MIENQYGQRYLPAQPRRYKSTAKNAQEAHEAIRPTDSRAHAERRFAALLDRDEAATLRADLEAHPGKPDGKRRARSGRGRYRVERPGIGAARHRLGRRFRRLPRLSGRPGRPRADERRGRPPAAAACAEGDPAESQGRALANSTSPSRRPRYTEASLVKKLEELGIGRPSTYASILQVLQDRDYVRFDKRRFVPQDRGRLVTAFLTSFFERYVEYDFTADLENSSTTSPVAGSTGRPCCATSGATSAAAVDGTKDLSISQVIEALDRDLGPHFFPEDGSRPGSPPLPGLQRRAAGAEAGPVRRLHRLLELSRMPLHPAARRRDRREGGTGADATAGPRISVAIPTPASR